MKRTFHILLLASVALLGGCLGDVYTNDSYRRQMIVEGRIEEGRGAEVMITLNLSFVGEITQEVLDGAVVRWAKVTLTCGDETEILTGYKSDKHISGFVYRSNRILGRAGKSYLLTVEYSGVTLTAETTIPDPVRLAELECVPIDDEFYTVRARFRDPEAKNAYLFECRTPDAGYYRPALLGIIDDSVIPGGEADITVNRPLDYVNIGEYSQYFRRGEEVSIRFSTVGAFGYAYWSVFENEVLNAVNPVFPSTHNLPSNIEGDGRGIWCGYASSYYTADCPLE